MVTMTTAQTQQRLQTPALRMLRRRGAVYLPVAGPAVDTSTNEAGVNLLEADLLDRGWLLSAQLRAALARLDTADLVSVGAELVADCDTLLGADRPHLPLFRRFPDSVPENTIAFFVDRLLAFIFQWPEQPCVLCDRDGTVQPVSPCGHLLCSACFDGADFSACPICHRRIDPAEPFLKAAPARPKADAIADPRRLRVLHLGVDLDADARAEVLALLARPTALSPQDAEDFEALLAIQPRDDLSWLPAQVPGRETKARLLAWLLADPVPAGATEIAGRLVDTATDVLRLLVRRSGGSSLIDRPRLAAVSRPLRRLLLALLERIHPVQMVEDMRRHERAWIAAGERLHPAEFGDRFPNAALAFAAIRRTDLLTHPAGKVLASFADGVEGMSVLDGRVRVASLSGRVERALSAADAASAAELLARRPGELFRRADHLLRVAGDGEQRERVVAALAAAAPHVSAAVLLSTLGEIRTRTVRHAERVFFPAGRAATAHVITDEREVLRSSTVDAVVALVEAEMLRRAAALPKVERAVVDTGLDGLVAPFAERTAARALLTLPRGSMLPVPDGRYLRLFCHWMENSSGPRVDLDLSIALFNDKWEHVGTCDYTSLRVSGAVHSGDLTSAPAPLGASEFVDLDVEQLHQAGARYAVMAILSFNNVAFTDMAEAFAGFMLRAASPPTGEVFDARAVEQRFDLTGPGKVTLPFVVDLAERAMVWLDVNARVTGTHHAVHRHHEAMATIARALSESIAAGGRVTVGELGRWLAAGRADEVLVRDNGSLTLFRRRDGEDLAAFAARLLAGTGDCPAAPEDAAMAGLQVLARGDLPTREGAEVYALHPASLDSKVVRLVAAPDLVASLAPTG